MSVALAKRHHHLTFTVQDLPHQVAQAERLAEVRRRQGGEWEHLERVGFQALDFTEGAVGGCDVYYVSVSGFHLVGITLNVISSQLKHIL
jgi:hypothetical protein